MSGNPIRKAIADLETRIAATEDERELFGLRLALSSARAAEAKFYPEASDD